MAEVKSLAYAIVDATDLDAWYDYGVNVVGLQVGERTDRRIRFRMDNKLYRLEINRADQDRITHIGWEVKGPAELEQLAEAVRGLGYDVRRPSAEEITDRCVVDLYRFTDPDGTVECELHYALHDSLDRFASPLGHSFVTGDGGAGHVFQLVQDVEAYEKLYFDVLGFRLSDWIEMKGLKLTFTHCNPRHHTFAFGGGVPGLPTAIGHLMVEVEDIDHVGRAHDKVLNGAARMISGLGRHTNDKMISFYMDSPSHFGVEFGTGGLRIDDASWLPTWYTETQYWGHSPYLTLSKDDPKNYG
ncbi:VOC family protein [Raineyella sp. W15-4]|uniref:VOC family protein n=1 Tax=Raineyella sp. W15-4 TaxID=3081651 RepID=UPI002952BB99|nr:VOC family protein [Raineyella sp. W15-4]WOQ15686.1 VOC family protein [Raineyella sp. W15-4]